MQARRLVLAAGLLLNSALSPAQRKPYTDVTLDHLSGPVRSSVAKTTLHESGVRLPDGISVLSPIMRMRCEYDPDGTRTLAENQQPGGPYGESLVVERDTQGYLYARRTLDLQTGETTRQERFGPHGVIDDLRYSNGKLTSEFLQEWDRNGHRSTSVARDGHGNQVSHGRTTFTADGVMKQEASWDADGKLEWNHSYDLAADVWHFRNYEKSGALRLSSTAVHGRLTSFWASEDNLYGSTFWTGSGLHYEESICHANGACDHLITDYLDEDQRNPKSTELRDSSGTLQAAAYFHYVLDAHDNWTSRIILVKVTDKQQPTLYEEDVRTLLYWPRP